MAVAATVSLVGGLALVAIAGSGPASASTVTWTPSGVCGGVDHVNVPADVYSMTVVVSGGTGGVGGNQSSGEHGGAGAAGKVTATLAVEPGQSLSATVGCPGVNGGDFANTGLPDGWSRGGGSGRGWAFNPLAGGSGGSGGGSSAVCLGGSCKAGDGTQIVVAGGGGGGGVSSCAGTRAGAGGAGGSQPSTANGAGAGPSGGRGTNGGNTGDNDTGGVGGAGGVNSTGGNANGGSAPNEDGGIASTTVVGGGGGGGFVGGLQGGNSQPLCRGGGGGGGGSNWVLSSATGVVHSTTTSAAQVTVTFAEPSPTTTTSTTTSTSTTTTTEAPAALGFLRVTTSPAVASQISLDGHIADTWGLQWVKVTPGSHQLCFSSVPGYYGPTCQTVNVNSGATTNYTAHFIARGYLHVVTSPAVASQITVDGIARNNWGVYTDLFTGTHEVCFGAVAGFTAPACQNADLTAGATTTITGNFVASAGTAQTGVGQLRVTTSPAVPSQISVDGNIADTWGLDWLEIAPGSHTVCYSHVQGFTEPACQSVSVTAGAITATQGTFTQRGYLHVVTNPAVASTISLGGNPANDWGVYTDVPVGNYHVCFGAVPTLNTPACQDPSVTAGATSTVTVGFS